jgi:ABC-2 type transport system permease protein
MRLFSDEYKEGTIERLKTLPISDSKLVLSKYFSGLIVSLMAIAPTLVYYYSVYQLSDTPGNVDSAGIIGSYIGLLLLSSLFVSIGVFASSTTKNQITSFLVAIIICSFFYFGFDLIASEISNGKIELAINYIGIDYHYNSLSKGVIDSRDIIYFLSLNALFILLTIHSIRNK